jgi:hypothetical protein
MEQSGPAWVPEACTLPTIERPLRVAAFDGLFADAVRGVERIAADRLHLELRAEPAVAGRAAELAAAETGCCSFFTFVLTVTGGSAGLDIVVPATQIAVLDALAERALSLCVLDRLPDRGLRSR